MRLKNGFVEGGENAAPRFMQCSRALNCA